MKLGFDAKRITHNATGLGNYGRIILSAFAEYYPTNEYFLYTPSPGNLNLRKQLLLTDSVSFHYPQRFQKIFPPLWRSYGISSDLKKDNINIFHGLSNELPFNIKRSGILSIVTIHDLIFLRYPKLYNPIDRRIYTCKFKEACLQADRIIAVSEQTKKDIISFFKIKENKIRVVYPGCNQLFYKQVTREEINKIKEKYAITQPYILYVGSIEERKNVLLAVKALSKIEKDVILIAVGRRTHYMDTVEAYAKENKLDERLRLLTNVPFEDLPALYQSAALFVYPSFFEGFGIPIAEALASNTPVIAATGSCLEEVGGMGSLYTNPNNIDELAELMNSVLNNQHLADSMRHQGAKYVERFSAANLSIELMSVYKEIL